MSPFLWFIYGALSAYGAYILHHIIKKHRENKRLRVELRERLRQTNTEPLTVTVSPEGYVLRHGGDIVITTASTPTSGYVQFGNGSNILSETAQRYNAARERSRELLLRFLDAEQAKQLADGNSFITTSLSGRKWEIRQCGIDLLDDIGDRIRSYCYLADEAEGLPVYDQMLARKLMVEHHEGQILRDGVVTYDRDAPRYHIETLPNGARVIAPRRYFRTVNNE